MKKLLCILLCLLCIPGNAMAIDRSKEIYVSAKGIYCDYKTIQEAVDAAGPGMTIYVRDGVYRENVTFNKSGQKGAPLVLKAYNKNAVIYGVIKLSDYITIDGFQMDGEAVTRADAVTNSGDGNTILNMSIKNYIGNAVQNSTTRGSTIGSSDTYIAHNYVENCGGGFMLGDDSVCEYNTMNGVNTFNTTAVTGDFSRALGKNIVIRGNLYYGTQPENLHRPGTDDVHADFVQAFDDNGIECANVLIEDNRAYGKYHQGIMIENDYYGPSGEFYVHDWTVRNNLFIGFHSWAICAGKPGGGIPNMNIYNNTFVGYTGEGNRTWNGVGLSGINGTAVVKNNIFAGLFSTSYFAKDGSVVDGDCNLIYEAPAPTQQGPHDVIGSDPMFADYQLNYTLDMLPTSDFRLTNVSPCIDRGTDVNLIADRDGVKRPQGKKIDIGAYEFIGTTGNVAPVMSFSGVENGEVLKEDEVVSIDVTAEDDDGIDRVEFYLGDTLLKTCKEKPYSCDFKTQQGTWAFYAVSYDKTGLFTKTSSATLFVTNETYVVGEAVWVNAPIKQKKKAFSVQFSVVPMTGGTNSVVGLSDGEAGAYSAMAAGFRINPENIFDVRDYDTYRADTVFAYEPGEFYDVRMDINPELKTFDVYVAKRGDTMVCLARGCRFRAQSTSINNWFTFAESGSTRVFSFTEVTESDQAQQEEKKSTVYTIGSDTAQIGDLTISIGDATPEISADTMMFPLDCCLKQFGAKQELRGDNVYFELNDTIFETNLGTNTILINGEEKVLSAPFYAKADGSIYLPLRQIFEAAGYIVIWNGENNSAAIK